MKIQLILIFFWVLSVKSFAQPAKYNYIDTLRGSITPERAWWDLKHYHLDISVNPSAKSIQGSNVIRYEVLKASQVIQIDLQPPLKPDSIVQEGKKLKVISRGPNALMIQLEKPQRIGDNNEIKVYYSGKPRPARHAPWDGGLSWSKDATGAPFIATSCQGLGASAWWPCKDHMYDEPDSMVIAIAVPDPLMAVSNGQLTATEFVNDSTKKYVWTVKNPINNYGVNMNIGRYISYNEVYQGEKGPLDVSYYVIKEDLTAARKQFVQVKEMLKAFEHWFGPYPFYEDGYKLVHVPYLGMEHQSSVTYGNKFLNGYLGTDLSGSGWGMKWDYIIVHESGHEWFANNITYKDIADMWIHESFTTYSECLFTEYYYGKAAGAAYVIGERRNIQNDRPIIGDYNVNNEGSGDMYFKGANMLHTLRQWVQDDEKWRGILRDINSTFYHSTVTTQDIETFLAQKTGLDLQAFFDQYLRSREMPELQYRKIKGGVEFRYVGVVSGFEMPIDVSDGKTIQRIYPKKEEWQRVRWKNRKEFKVLEDYLVKVTKISSIR